MNTFFLIYTISWCSLCLLAIIIAIANTKHILLFQRRYWQFLLRPWKLITFLIATLGLALIAPYTGDPTWDYTDATFMAILTFATAPWAIGTIYHCIKKGCPFKFGFVAFCTWMFSASWSYDIYIYLRYGYYPETWLPNIFLSSTLYASAGFLWNLEASKKRGVMFSFMSPDWLNTNSSDSFSKLIFHALPFMLFVAILILAFLL